MQRAVTTFNKLLTGKTFLESTFLFCVLTTWKIFIMSFKWQLNYYNTISRHYFDTLVVQMLKCLEWAQNKIIGTNHCRIIKSSGHCVQSFPRLCLFCVTYLFHTMSILYVFLFIKQKKNVFFCFCVRLLNEVCLKIKQ